MPLCLYCSNLVGLHRFRIFVLYVLNQHVWTVKLLFEFKSLHDEEKQDNVLNPESTLENNPLFQVLEFLNSFKHFFLDKNFHFSLMYQLGVLGRKKNLKYKCFQVYSKRR